MLPGFSWLFRASKLSRKNLHFALSALFYGSLIWMNNSNMDDINKLLYRVSKAATGAVFNTHSAIVEVILGVPPIQIMRRVIAIKHYLKALSDVDDIHFQFISNQIQESNPIVLSHLRDVQKFLNWKAENFEDEIELRDTLVLSYRNLDHLPELSLKTLKYTKGMMQNFTELLWQDSLDNRLQMEGWASTPLSTLLQII